MDKYSWQYGLVTTQKWYQLDTPHVSWLDELDSAGEEGRLPPGDDRPVVHFSKERLLSQELQAVLQLTEFSWPPLWQIKLFISAVKLPFIRLRFPHLQ